MLEPEEPVTVHALTRPLVSTVMRMVTAYSMLANGGRRIRPTLIDRIQDRNGRVVFRHDRRGCGKCRAKRWTGQAPPQLPNPRDRVAGAASAYQIVSMLKGVVLRGTGRRVRAVGKPLAGKTGTTNRSHWAQEVR